MSAALNSAVKAHLEARDRLEAISPTASQAAFDEAHSAVSETLTAMRAICDGNRPLPFSRDDLGRMVREAWVRWAVTQPSPKPSWLVPYDELDEADKEADRQIGEAVARWTLIGDAARAAERIAA